MVTAAVGSTRQAEEASATATPMVAATELMVKLSRAGARARQSRTASSMLLSVTLEPAKCNQALDGLFTHSEHKLAI